MDSFPPGGVQPERAASQVFIYAFYVSSSIFIVCVMRMCALHIVMFEQFEGGFDDSDVD